MGVGQEVGGQVQWLEVAGVQFAGDAGDGRVRGPRVQEACGDE